MSQTYIGSALRTGSDTLTDSVDGGWVVVSQATTVTSDAGGNVTNGTITIPDNSQIIDIIAEKLVNWTVGGGTANALNIRVGSAANGATYFPTTNMAATVVSSGSLTSANVLARSNVASNVAIYCSVDPDGNIATTQAQIQFTVLYAQR